VKQVSGKPTAAAILGKKVGIKNVAKASIPFVSPISFKAIAPTKTVKAAPKAKAAVTVKAVAQTKTAVTAKPVAASKPQITVKPAAVEITPKPAPIPVPSKPVTPAPVYAKTEIIKSNLNLKEDYTANPHDYETQTFDFALACPHNHLFSSGTTLPLSKGRAFCPECGEKLRKPQRRKRYANKRTFV
jgi:predicted nucleic acid-binding Zn ribbon protein